MTKLFVSNSIRGDFLEYIVHPMLNKEKVQARLYQQILFAQARLKNNLIVLPTGLGKTIIMVMLIAAYLKKEPTKKIVVIAPTRPLIDQHLATFRSMLKIDDPELQISLLSGGVKPDMRKEIWQQSRVLIATPQTLRNDIVAYIDLEEVSLMCVDEAHRAVKDDAYVFCTRMFAKTNGRICGFTASPGSKDVLQEVIHNLSIEDIQYMDETNTEVTPYINDIEEEIQFMQLPDNFLKIISILKEYKQNFVTKLKEIDVVEPNLLKNPSKSTFLKLPALLNNRREIIGETAFFTGMKSYGQLMLVSHAIELIETQCLVSLSEFFNKKEEELRLNNRRGLRYFLHHDKVRRVKYLTNQLISQQVTHPKLDRLVKEVKGTISANSNSRVLVFANYKSTVNFLVKQLNKDPIIQAHKFVGQTDAKSSGLTQKRQKQVMDQFRSGQYNVLVSTSVGEEGLDVAQCDLVVFYEAIPSATRYIQRRGRTGRARAGNVLILVTKGTRDEGFYYSAKRRKKQIREHVMAIKEELASGTYSPNNFNESSNHKSKENGVRIDTGSLNQHSPVELDIPINGEATKKSDTNGRTASSQKLGEQDEKKNPLIFKNSQSVSQNTAKNRPTIYIDNREKGSAILLSLMNHDIDLIPETLQVGDYVVSDRVAIERKKVDDFAETLQRGDLFSQLIRLKNAYEKPILIIEGENLYSSAVHKNAIRGCIASLLLDFNINILHTKDVDETASMIVALARREQIKKRHPRIHKTLGKGDLRQKQVNWIASLPEINIVLAQRLLQEFGTPKQVFLSHPDELMKIKGIGRTKADYIDQMLTNPYQMK